MEQHITKDFIGSTFKVEDKGTLTAIKDNSLKGNKKLYYLSCSFCSEDIELFPDLFTSSKYNICNENIPCGCSKSPRWNEDQQIIRITRKCKEKNIVFKGWFGDYKKVLTKLVLKCVCCNHEWNTTTIDGMFNSNVGCVQCSLIKTSLRCKKDDQVMIDDFMLTGLYSNDTRFWRSERTNPLGYKIYWWYECTVCNKDEYYANGVCSGVFEASRASLLISPSCRCASTYYWNQQEREYQINKIMKDTPLTFTGWEDGKYTGAKCSFNYNCSEHGDKNTTVDSFIMQNTRCPDCSPNGFNTHKPAYLYLVRWYNDHYTTLKFGITGREALVRIGEQASESPLDYEILHTFYFDVGQTALDLENKIKSLFDCKSCPKELLPDGWTETIEYSQENIDKLLSIVSSH